MMTKNPVLARLKVGDTLHWSGDSNREVTIIVWSIDDRQFKGKIIESSSQFDAVGEEFWDKLDSFIGTYTIENPPIYSIPRLDLIDDD